MITVENLLMAYASAYDAWLDPEAERKNPTPEYAELIRQAVSFENAKLRELVDILCFCMQIHKRCDDCKLNGAKGELGLGHDPLLACDGLHDMLKELGIEVD